jgi:acyl carrier protein
MTSTFDRVKKIIVEQLDVDPALVVPGASFIDDLGADSLDKVELFFAVEAEFGCDLGDDDFQAVTVGDLVALVDGAVNEEERRQ